MASVTSLTLSKRQPNFTTGEVEALLQMVEGKSRVLFGKFSGVMSVVSKQAAWDEVARDVSAVSGVKRSAAEVKKKWMQLKSKAKEHVVAVKKDRVKTGGGERTATDVSENDSRIIAVVGEACVKGVAGGFDLGDVLVEKMTGLCMHCS